MFWSCFNSVARALLGVAIMYCLAIISPGDAAAQKKDAAAPKIFTTDIYIAVPPAGGELDGKFMYQLYYSDSGQVLIPKSAFAKNDVIAFDDKFEGAKGLKTAIDESMTAANKEFGKADVKFEVRNIYFVSGTNKHLKGSFISQDNPNFDLGLKDGKSTLLSNFEKLTADKTDAFNILMAPVNEGKKKIEMGWGETPGNSSVVDISSMGNKRDGGFILIHELGHNLGLNHHNSANPFNTAMAPSMPARGSGEASKKATPKLTTGDISTIKANVEKGTYKQYLKPKKTSYLAPSDQENDRQYASAGTFVPATPVSTNGNFGVPGSLPGTADTPDSSWVVNSGFDIGSLDRGATATLGTDDGVSIAPINLLSLSNDELIALYYLDLIHQFYFGGSVWEFSFGLTYGFSDSETVVDRVPVGPGNNLLIFSPQGLNGGLNGGLGAGARDAVNIHHENEFELGEYRLGFRTPVVTGPRYAIKAGPIFSYGHQDVTEKLYGSVAGINQNFAYHNAAEIMTYSIGGSVDIEHEIGTLFGAPVEYYGGASLEAQFHDNDGYSRLDLSGLVNATEQQDLGGSETTARFQAYAGLSFDIGQNTELSVGARYRAYDTTRIEIAPQQAARITFDDSDEITGYFRLNFGFGPPVHESPILRGTSLSDRRLKRDIALVATLDNGIKLYSFKDLWEDRVRVGVMAQDLLAQDAFRSAVVALPNGFYAVNYQMLGLKMAALDAWRHDGVEAVMATPGNSQVSSLAPALLQ